MLNTRQSPRGSGGLTRRGPRTAGPTGESAPHDRRLGGIVHLAFTLVCGAALLSAPAAAGAEDLAGPREPLPDRFVGVAAVASAARVEGAWDSAFGAELGVGRLDDAGGADEVRRLPLWAVSAGVLGFGERSGGRAWAEVTVGTRWPFGIPIGLGVGPAVELDDLRQPRWGGQATLFAMAGVIPYVRLGVLQEGGTFVDAGIRIAFPVVRW